jgi:hypothetical protein
MINNSHILAEIARERSGTFLAEAEADRRAKQARPHRQRAGTPGAHRWRLLLGLRPVAAAARFKPNSASAHSSQRPRGVSRASAPEPGRYPAAAPPTGPVQPHNVSRADHLEGAI